MAMVGDQHVLVVPSTARQVLVVDTKTGDFSACDTSWVGRQTSGSWNQGVGAAWFHDVAKWRSVVAVRAHPPCDGWVAYAIPSDADTILAVHVPLASWPARRLLAVVAEKETGLPKIPIREGTSCSPGCGLARLDKHILLRIADFL